MDSQPVLYEPLAEMLARRREDFAGPHLDMVVASISAGNTEGELWGIPEGGSSPLLILWDKGNNVLYLAEDAPPSGPHRALERLAAHVRLRMEGAGRVRFRARALSPWLEAVLPRLFPEIALHESRTLFLVDSGTRPLAPAACAVSDIAFEPITRHLLISRSFKNSDDVLDEICSMWPSVERFFEYGFGMVAIRDGEIICWCTAEYLSQGRCGIGIATLPRFEGRGVATATATHFVGHARARAVTSHWECNVTNLGSVRVAEKLGFTPLCEETFWAGSFAQSRENQAP